MIIISLIELNPLETSLNSVVGRKMNESHETTPYYQVHNVDKPVNPYDKKRDPRNFCGE